MEHSFPLLKHGLCVVTSFQKVQTEWTGGKRNVIVEEPDKPSFSQGTRVTSTVKSHRDFPGGAVVKNSPANAGDIGSSPGPGRSHMPRSN